MTPEQKTALVEACEKGDAVRIVTIALQVAAWLARNKRQDDAIEIRLGVDDLQQAAERKQRRAILRDQFAAASLSGWRSSQCAMFSASKMADLAYADAEAMLVSRARP